MTVEKKFVVVVDTQYDFMMPDGALYVPGAENLIVPLNNYLATLKPAETVGVLWTYDTHDIMTYGQTEESKVFPPHCLTHTPGHENVLNMNIVKAIGQIVAKKETYSMWESTFDLRYDTGAPAFGNDIEKFAAAIALDVDVVEVVGVVLGICVKAAVEGFVRLGFKVRVRTDLTQSLDIGNGANDTDPRLVFAALIAEGRVELV